MLCLMMCYIICLVYRSKSIQESRRGTLLKSEAATQKNDGSKSYLETSQTVCVLRAGAASSLASTNN